jgi:hypothetical protein
MSCQVFSTPEIKDKIRLADDSRDAAAAGLTAADFNRMLDSASYALCRAFPAERAEFRFRCRRYYSTMQTGQCGFIEVPTTGKFASAEIPINSAARPPPSRAPPLRLPPRARHGRAVSGRRGGDYRGVGRNRVSVGAARCGHG